MGLKAVQIAGFSPGDLENLQFWFTPEEARNGINTTPPETFSSLFNRGLIGGNVVDAVKAQQPLRATPNGRLAAVYDNTDRELVSGAAKVTYRFLHNGTGCTAWGAARRSAASAVSHTFIDTLRVNDTRTGFDCSQVGSTQALRIRIGNSSGTYVVEATSANNTFPTNGLANVWVFRWNTADGFELRINGVVRASGAVVGVPAAGDSFGNFTWGNRANGGGSEWRGDMLEGGAYSAVLTTPEVVALEQYLSRKWSG